MVKKGLIDAGALISVVGGVVWVCIWLLFFRLHGPGPEDRQATLLSLTHYDFSKFLVIPLLLFVAGLLSLSARQMGRGGWLAKAGMAIAVIGYTLMILGVVLSLWPIPWGSYVVDWEAPLHKYGGLLSVLGTLIVSIGMICLAITVVRVSMLPGWVAVPLILGPLATIPFLHMTLWGWIFGLAWLLIGYWLRISKRVEDRQEIEHL